MKVIEYADRFARTSIDFWRLRPRDFVAATAATTRSADGYLSPYEFLAVFWVIGTGIYAVTITLVFSAAFGRDIELSELWVGAAAFRTLALVVFLVVVNAVYVRAISRFWPVRGRAKFTDILEYQIYALAMVLPIMVIDLLVLPLLVWLIAEEIVSAWSLLLYVAAAFGFGFVVQIVKDIPGVAAVNGVSTARMWGGLLFWPFIVVMVGELILVLVIVTINNI